MLEGLFGSKVLEKILFYLLLNDTSYGREMEKIFPESLSTLQKGLDRLESGGIIVSQLQGKTRVYTWNPRYPYLKELQSFLRKAYQFIPEEKKTQLYERKVRKRPRRKGKPL